MVQMIVAPSHFQDQGCGSVDFGVKPQTYISMSYFHEKLSEIKVNLRKYSMNSVGGLLRTKVH